MLKAGKSRSSAGDEPGLGTSLGCRLLMVAVETAGLLCWGVVFSQLYITVWDVAQCDD